MSISEKITAMLETMVETVVAYAFVLFRFYKIFDKSG